MRIVRSIPAMQKLSGQLIANGQKIGLVPTMGFLHDGHLSLIKRAKKLSDIVITTIFVNPTQFAPNEDLDKYPRDEKGDLAKIKSVGGDIVFIPRAGDIYDDNFQTYVNVEKITHQLEGEKRPTHFRGVTTVVAKLFNMTRPNVAVFGQKDFQQAAVLKQMTRDLNFPINIVIAPIIRDEDGLALSSRNKYLSLVQREEAICLYKALLAARNILKHKPRTKLSDVKTTMLETIVDHCPTAQVEYISFNHAITLEEAIAANKNTICSLAVKLHGVRLIDNMKMI